MAVADPLQQKKAFFDKLYALDEQSEEEDDVGLNTSIKLLESKIASSHVAPTPAAGVRLISRSLDHPTHGTLNRTLSAPSPIEHSTSELPPSVFDRKIPELAKISNQTSNPPATLQHRHTVTGLSGDDSAAMPTSSAMPRASGKRKRDSNIKLAPEDQQIFRGLRFYFFPNTDVNPARRMRITKALEYGASWQREWDDSVTHVVVDKSMNYDQVLRFLKLEALPDNVILVDEVYPAECISYRMLLDPKQNQYQVSGYAKPGATDAQPSAAALVGSQISDVSLQLKPAGKSVMARQPRTPSRTEETPSQHTTGAVVENPTGPSAADGADDAVMASSGSDELDAAINQARQLQDLPFDVDEEETSRPASSSNADTDDEGEPEYKKRKPDVPAWQEKFQCMQKHAGDKQDCPNARTISVLQKMADYYTQVRDEWRSRAYRQAIATLRNHPVMIRTKQEALALHNIGERLADKIEEIVFTHRLRRLDNALREPHDHILSTFMKIYGVGHAQASKWVAQGHRSLSDLLLKAHLTENQLVGIKHFDDFNARIPRAEVEKHAMIVRSTLRGIDARFHVYTMGSYRRGAEDSGDIDLIITRPGTPLGGIRQVVMETLIPQLFSSGFLKATLASSSSTSRSSSSSSSTDNGGSKWHGASCLPTSTIWRRIDFLFVPEDELGAALIYFTGNDIFNRSLRLLASRKGMRLNQRGLYRDVLRDWGREKLSEGTLVEGKSERKIFEALGVPWRPPEHRVC